MIIVAFGREHKLKERKKNAEERKKERKVSDEKKKWGNTKKNMLNNLDRLLMKENIKIINVITKREAEMKKLNHGKEIFRNIRIKSEVH